VNNLRSHLKRILTKSVAPTLRAIAGPYYYEKIRSFAATGRWPDIDNPKTFNEKISHLKIFSAPPDASALADKLAVRHVVKAAGYAHILPVIYAVFESEKEIDSVEELNLPDKYALKGNQGSGDDFVELVSPQNPFDLTELKKRAKDIIRGKFGHLSNEPWYLEIKPKVFIEEHLGGTNGAPPADYKFFVFSGKVRAISVDSGRFTGNHLRTFYDRDWRPFSFQHPDLAPAQEEPVPSVIDEMIEIAERLSGDAPFRRIDLYCIDDARIVFGEITIAPRAGYGHWPSEFADFWQ